MCDARYPILFIIKKKSIGFKFFRLISYTLMVPGGAYDLAPVILEWVVTINDNLRNGGNHNGKEEKC